MRVLVLHKRFPGQLSHLVRDLAARGAQVFGLGQTHVERLAGVVPLAYAPTLERRSVVPEVGYFEDCTANGVAVARACREMQAAGVRPDLVIGHAGWGETMFVKDVWPDVPLIGYFEFFYHWIGADVGFDPEFPPDPALRTRLRTRNAAELVSLEAVDWGFTASRWQRELYPAAYRDRITAVHEGVDSDAVCPDPAARLTLPDGRELTAEDEVVTYSARDLDPYRGFHVFLRALPEVLRARPQAEAVIIGGDGGGYGAAPPEGGGWKERLIAEVGGSLDLARVHFLGKTDYATYLAALRISAAHTYLTLPFIPSWSLYEALSAGCLVVGSRTPPVEEVIAHGDNGLLVDFLDVAALAETLVAELSAPRAARAELRATARRTVVERYDLTRVTLPRQRRMIDDVLAGRWPDID